MRTLSLALLLGLTASFLATNAMAMGKRPEVPAEKEASQQDGNLKYFAHVEYDQNAHETHLTPVLPDDVDPELKKAIMAHAEFQFGEHDKAISEHDGDTATLFDFGKFMKSATKKVSRVADAAAKGEDWQKTLGEQLVKSVKDVSRSMSEDPKTPEELTKQAVDKAKEAGKTSINQVATPTPAPMTGPKLPPPPPVATPGAPTNLPPPPVNLPPPPPITGAVKLPPPPADLPPPPYTPPAEKVAPHPPTTPPPAGLLGQIQAGKQLKHVETQAPATPTGQSALLQQIQAGKQLKHVEPKVGEKRKAEQSGLMGALSGALDKRRKAVSPDPTEEPTNDDEWE